MWAGKPRRASILTLLVCLLLTGGCTRAKPALDAVADLTGLVTGATDPPAAPADAPTTAPTDGAAQPTALQPTAAQPTTAVQPTAPLATAIPGQPTPTITPWPTFTPFPMADTPLAVLTPPELVPTDAPVTVAPTSANTTTPTLAVVPTVLIVDATPTISATEIITQDVTYTVAAGDTLLKIAQHYGTSTDAIANRNGLVSKNAIYAGQELVIPSGYGPDDEPPPMVVSHTVAKGETLSIIGRRYRTTPSEIVAQNSSVISDPNNVAPGTVLSITVGTAPVQIVHTVGRGDTVASIARRYGVSVEALVRANAISNPNKLTVGRVLLIPR